MNKSGFWLTGLGLFLMGALTGALAMGTWFSHRANPMARMERMGPTGFVMDRLTRELGLSEDQRRQIAPIVTEMMDKRHAASQPCREAEERLFDEETAKIRALLTPEQAARHAEIVARLKSHRPPFGPPPPPPPDGPGWGFGPPPPPPPMASEPPAPK